MAAHPDSLLIDRMGGATALSKLCGCTSQAVSMWRRTGIPKTRRMYLELARPDVFAAESALAGGCGEGAAVGHGGARSVNETEKVAA